MARALSGLMCAAALALPAPASAASIEARDNEFRDPANLTPSSTVTIVAGDSVTFAYPSGTSAHNVDFTGTAPTSCVQNGGSGPVPRLPPSPQGPGWSGSCRFDAPGTYAFLCDAHSFMTGSVIVQAPPAPPGPGPGPVPGPGTPPPSGVPPTATSSSPTPIVALPAAAARLVLARTQRGTVVRGSILVARGGSRLRVDVLARRSALGGRGSTNVAVGRYAKTVSAGRRAFSVRLSAAARRALRRKGRLRVTIKISVRPVSGATYSATRRATVRR
jgi:plastocyanin